MDSAGNLCVSLPQADSTCSRVRLGNRTMHVPGFPPAGLVSGKPRTVSIKRSTAVFCAGRFRLSTTETLAHRI